MTAKRIKKTTINILPIIVVIVFISVVSTAIYFLFVKPSSINCGIFLDKRQNGNTINVKLGCGDKIKWIKVNKRIGLPEGLAYNVKLRGIVVTSITPCKSYSGKVYSYDIDKKRIELENGYKKLSQNAVFYKINNKEQKAVSPNSLIIGTTNSKFIENNGNITAILVENPDLTRIRVGLSTKIRRSQSHKDIILYSKRIITIKYEDTIIRVKDYALGISYKNGFMEINAYDQDGNDLKYKSSYGKTKARIYAYSDYDFAVPISFKSFDKGDTDRYAPDFPRYFGELEFSIKDNFIRAINEVDIDSYTNNVVLSKMNNLGDYPTACSVQAVAARTFTTAEILSGKYGKYGYHIADSLASQPYNLDFLNLDKKPKEISTAIDATAGLVMTYNGKLVDTKAYSTSCGVGTPYSDVWFEGTLPDSVNPKPYLAFNNYTNSEITNLDSEATAAKFLMDWTIKSYDSNSKYFRWKYNIDLPVLNKIVNKNIYKLYTANKQNFKKKWYFNIYRQAKIPKAGIGTITDLYVSKRGVSGNVLELTIISETGDYHITKDANIKALLLSSDINIDFIYGSPMNGFSKPLSSFFVIDRNVSGNTLKSLVIYGGGSGHGVGMSQYGVIGMIRAGKGYKEILKTFYRNVDFKNWQDIVDSDLK